MHTCQCFIRMQGQLRELHPKSIRRLQVPSKTPRQRAHRCSNPARGLLLPACTSDPSQQSSSLLELEPHATPVCGTGTCCHQLAQQHSSCGAAAPSSCCCCCCCASWQLGKCPYRPQPPPPQRAVWSACRLSMPTILPPLLPLPPLPPPPPRLLLPPLPPLLRMLLTAEGSKMDWKKITSRLMAAMNSSAMMLKRQGLRFSSTWPSLT